MPVRRRLRQIRWKRGPEVTGRDEGEWEEEEGEDVREEKRGELMRMEDGNPEENREDNGAPREGVRRADADPLSGDGCCSCSCSCWGEKSCDASRSSVVIRSEGSLRRRELMTTRAIGEMLVGIWKSPRRIFPNR